MRLGLSLKIVAGVVVVIAAGIGIFIATFDVERYKPQLIAAAKDATGRDLTIDGKLSLSLFPRLAVAADKVTFANAPWGSRPAMATVGSFAVEVEGAKLIFDRQLVIDRLALKDVDLLLETGADGQANWDFQKAAATPAQAQAPAQTPGPGGERVVPQVGALSLEKVKLTYRNGRTREVREANVVLLDMTRASAEQLAVKLNAEINGAPVELAGMLGRFDHLLDGTPWPVDVKGKAAGATVALAGTVANPTTAPTLDFKVAAEGANLADLGALTGVKLPATPPYKLAGAVSGDPAKEIKLVGVTIALGKTQATVDGTVGNLAASPTVNLKISAQSPDPSELSTLARFELPRQPSALQAVVSGSPASEIRLGQGTSATIGNARFATEGSIANLQKTPTLNLRVAVEGEDLAGLGALAGIQLAKGQSYKLTSALTGTPASQIKLTGLNATLGPNQLSGDIGVTLNGPRPRIDAKLTSPVVDVDRLMATAGLGDVPAKPAGAPAPAPAAPAKPAAADGRVIPNDPLPLDVLTLIDGDIALTTPKFVNGALQLANLNARAVLNDGQLALKPFAAQLDGSPFNLDLNLNAKTGAIAAKGDGRGLMLGDMLKKYGLTEKLKGAKTDLAFDLTGSGKTTRALAASLNGQVTINAGEGTIAGSYGDILGDGLATVLRLQESRGAQTHLYCAVTRLDLRQGVATARVMTIDTGRLTVQGKGDINLGTEALALTLDPAQVPLPILVRGTLAHPTYAPDPAGLAKLGLGAALGAATGGTAGLLAGVLGQTQTPTGSQGGACAKAVAAIGGKPVPAAAPQQQQQQQQQQQKRDPIGNLLQGLGGVLRQ